MKRRLFLKLLISLASLPLFLKSKYTWADEEYEVSTPYRIWSYYVPLTSYDKILETSETMNPLDRKVIFEEVIKQTNRISGKETDGTKNTASFTLEELENAPEYIRVHFWHDDNERPSGHTLYVFKRYLEELEKGNKVFVATGMTQSHFHVVMIQPQ